ncbi:MAG: hypothetical protein PHF56_12520 [Desulfuromonadaceae bacterium]|nr:hypothetical protein [Desulfuromonadaceae bacterium]
MQLNPRQVFLFSGHMIDAPDRSEPRFPATQEAAAARAIRDILDRLDAGSEDLALCSGACGGDILFTEACLQREAQLEMQLPFAIPAFLEKSVTFAGESWRTRFYAIKNNRLTTLFIMPDKAHEKKYDEKNRKLETYPLLNWLAAEVLRKWYGMKPEVIPAEIVEWCEKARGCAEEKDRLEPNFWNSVVSPECDLVLALADGTLDQQKQAVVDAYRHAKARGASPRQFSSVIDHLEFLAEMTAEAGKHKEVKQQAATLREVVEQLKV